ncbi:MAG: hypothetical protein HFJ17_00300 [Clostridia bacterium]|nr:hypothetical protein [Clostridia bacterium]
MKEQPTISTYSWENGKTTETEYVEITVLDGYVTECIHKVKGQVDKRQNGDIDFYNLVKVCFEKLVIVEPELFKSLYKKLRMDSQEYKTANRVRLTEIGRLKKILETLS